MSIYVFALFYFFIQHVQSAFEFDLNLSPAHSIDLNRPTSLSGRKDENDVQEIPEVTGSKTEHILSANVHNVKNNQDQSIAPRLIHQKKIRISAKNKRYYDNLTPEQKKKRFE